MVTKRQLMAAYERVDNAIARLPRVFSSAQIIEIIDRDLAPAKEALEYAMSVAE